MNSSTTAAGLNTSVLTSTTLPPTTTRPAALYTFNGTCVPTQYPCRPSTRYIDPCDCSYYYLCRDSVSIVRHSCAGRTAFDHTSPTAYCRGFKQVVGNGKCDQNAPWKRCLDQYSQADIGKLERWCKGTGYFTPVQPKRGGDDGGSGGAIAAVVILLLLIIGITVGVVIYVRKKGNPIQHIKESRFWREVIRREGREPEYTEERDEDSDAGSHHSSSPRYNAARDSVCHDPETQREAYNKAGDSTVTKERKSRHNSYSEERYPEEGGAAAYDNPAMDRDTPPPDTENSPAPPAYSTYNDPSQDAHYRARELNEMDNDPDGIYPTIDEDGYTLEDHAGQLHHRQSPPPISFGDDGNESPLNNSFSV